MMMIEPAKLAHYRATAQKRQQLAEQRLRERLTRANVVAQQAAAFLRQFYGVERIALFGSVAQPQRFHARSDIDLAVWGLDERCYYRAVGELQALTPEFAIDLIRGEEASLWLVQTIEAEEVLL
ncbi:MAG: nucleotidyltransferase family protein [Caldilineaceae bacterium]|jgi:predicted nucleotidyltransferase